MDPDNKFKRCIIKLGTSGNVFGFDVDTSHFNGMQWFTIQTLRLPVVAGHLPLIILGNEAPQVSVQAAYIAEGTVPKEENPEV